MHARLLDKNQPLEKDKSEAVKELEGRIGPVMMKVYQAAGGDFGGLPERLDRKLSEVRGVMEDLDLHKNSGDVDIEVTDCHAGG